MANDSEPGEHPHHSWRKSLLWSAGLAAVVTVLHAAGAFERFERPYLDAMAMAFPPSPTGEVLAVTISDDDFANKDLFAGISPLDPATLYRIFENLARQQPAVIAIDIEIDPPANEVGDRIGPRHDLYRGLTKLIAAGRTHWVLVEPEHESPAGIDPDVQTAWRNLLHLAEIMPDRLTFASPEIVVEEGEVRHLSPRIEGKENLLGAIVAARHTGEHGVAADEHEPVLIRFTRAFSVDRHDTPAPLGISVGEFLAVKGTGRPSVFTDRIVILGGSHEYGRDFHWTPVGRMAAVEIWAEGVDCWLRGDSPHEAPVWVGFVLETAIGLLGGWLMQWAGPWRGFAVTLLVLAPATVALSALTFGSGWMFINFLPSFVGVRLHLRAELWNHVRDLEARLATLTAELNRSAMPVESDQSRPPDDISASADLTSGPRPH